MKLLKRIGLGLLALLAVLLAVVAVYVTRSFPALDGELKAPGLQQPVAIERDGSDVTHIKAKNGATTPSSRWAMCMRRSAAGSSSSTAA